MSQAIITSVPRVHVKNENSLGFVMLRVKAEFTCTIFKCTQAFFFRRNSRFILN